VGAGLCSSALGVGMKVTTATFGGPPSSLFVGGSFRTRAWSGGEHDFVDIFNLAHFNATSGLWSPLRHGQLTCSWCVVTVLALAWDERLEVLHVGGKFNAIDGSNIPPGEPGRSGSGGVC
jgi:hypothetical protein